MSVIKISAPNLNDISSFDQVQFGQADDASGTNATVLATQTADSSDRSKINPGSSYYVYTNGSTTKYYSARGRRSSDLVTTDWATWVLGGKDRWDSMFENEMQDTANDVFTQNDVARFKTWALEALYPDLFKETIDTSLTVDNDTTPQHTYTVPFGIFDISEVGIGDVNNTSSTFVIVSPDNWKHEGDKLHFASLAGLSNALTIRLVASKKYVEVGEVPERYDRFVMHYLKMSAYLRLADDFPRFLKWARLQDGTKVSFESLRVHAREFERKFLDGKAEARELALSSRYR